MNKFKLILLTVLMSLTLTGCWDRVEIDKKSFFSAIGIDVGEDIESKDLKNMKPGDPFFDVDIKRINVTYSSPDMSKVSPGKGNSTVKDNTLTVSGYSMEDTMNKANGMSSRDLKFGYTRVLVLNNRILNYPEVFKEIIDYFQRQPTINRMMYVVAVDDKVEEFMKFKPGAEANIHSYISGLMENSSRNSTILPVTLNELFILLSNNGNAILPEMTIDKEKNQIKLSGLNIIRDYTLRGKLTPAETSSLEMLRGKLKGGKKVIFKDGHPIDFEIDGIARKINVTMKEGKLNFNVKIELEGKIKGAYIGANVYSNKFINEIQEGFNKTIQQECEKVVKKTQDEFEVDPIGFREYLIKFKPGIWKKVQDNWQSEYKNADINVQIKTNIRRIGVIK